MSTPSKRSKPSARNAAGRAEFEPNESLPAEASSTTGDWVTETEPVEEMSAASTTAEIESLPAAQMTLELSVSAAEAPEPVDSPATAEVKPPPAALNEDDDATLVHPAAPSRPRKTTLAMAIPASPVERSPVNEPAEPVNPSQGSGQDVRPPVPPATGELHAGSYSSLPAVPSVDALPPELLDEVDEWSIADQPTIYLSPQLLTRPKGNVRSSNPSTPRPRSSNPSSPASPVEPAPVEPPPLPWSAPSSIPGRRASGPAERETPLPSGPFQAREADVNRVRRTPPPPARPLPGASTGAGRPQPVPLRDPRMERFQYLREERIAHQEGSRGPGDARPVADIVRQWWRDLRPGLDSALDFQREARITGSHPIPATEATPTSRLGDAFGRLAASARGLTGRAQSAMAPKINRLQELHAQAETAASAFVQKFEAPAARQQAPLLGPGRIAVFFKQGVTVGQAQSLLGATRARPIRLIPRKHGFLALVAPGSEAEVSVRLREHPYVRDVAYLEYNEFGEAIQPR